jgi:hypothetical protein
MLRADIYYNPLEAKAQISSIQHPSRGVRHKGIHTLMGFIESDCLEHA